MEVSHVTWSGHWASPMATNATVRAFD